MKRELLPVPVSEVNRAKAFCVDQLGFVHIRLISHLTTCTC
jgi:hypothetical protein